MLSRKALALLLVAALVLGLTSAALAAGQNPDPGKKEDYKFPDWAESAWAFRHMARMKFMNVMRGYEDGNFKPNGAISQAEALVMVIRMRDAEAAAEALSNTTTLVIPGVNRMWAWGYIKYALDHNWISLDGFNPSRAASRLWVAALLVKAFGEASATAPQLTAALVAFSDISELADADKGFIAVAFAKGWILGYPDGTFKPNKPVTRAEMAALLDRGEGILPKAYQAANVKGLVISTSSTGTPVVKTIVVLKDGETAATSCTLADNALIIGKGHAEVAFADIHALDYVRILLDSAGKAAVVTVEDKKVIELTGTVTAKVAATTTTLATITLSYGGASGTFNVTADAVLKKADGTTAAFADVVGAVVVKIKDNVIIELQIKPV
ncbi:MAG: S-layer homology domain-containing protein, partial [Bacillota bacterium]|nr:S-layer homology domain-containing protein [Bacillota bacterium]